jgi:hypothetical protein
MSFPTGQVIALTGTAMAGGAAAISAFLNRNSAALQTGELVRQNIPPEMDTYAQYLCSRGAPQRGWVWRTARQGQRAGQNIIHPGKDITAPPGMLEPVQAHTITIHAARSGIVEHSGQGRGYGECILLRHRDGSTTWYAHLNERLVQRGQVIRGGDVIAHMGRTSTVGARPTDPTVQGRSCATASGRNCDPRCSGPDAFTSMNPHLHFSVHGVPIPAGAQSGPGAQRGEKLPALPPARSDVRAWGGVDLIAMSTDNWRGARLNEYEFGVDPEAWLGEHGIRLAASA